MIKGYNDLKGLDPKVGESAGGPQHADMTYFGDMSIECQLPSRCLHGIFDQDTIGANY